MSELPNRPVALHSLGRTDRRVPPIVWRPAPASDLPRVLQHCADVGTDWFLIDSDLPLPDLDAFAGAMAGIEIQPTFLMGLHVGQLTPRAARVLEERLSSLKQQRCEAAVIQGASVSAIKAGGPFHRLVQLRDRGLISHYIIEAEDVTTAAWMLEHTPAHALALPFGLPDLTAKYRILPLARELGVALLANPVSLPAWEEGAEVSDEINVAFLQAEENIAAGVLALPDDVVRLERLVQAAANPLPAQQHDAWWMRFQAAVSPPPTPIRNLPPELM